MNISIESFEGWLESKNLSKVTIGLYLYYLKNFETYKEFTQENVSAFLRKRKNKNGVARAFLENLKNFLKINYKELEINRSDIMEVELPKLSGRKKQRIIKPLSEEQILLLEKHLPEEKYKLQLLMSYYGGLRVEELYRIKIVSFNWNGWKEDMKQFGECLVLGKGAKEGITFFPPDLMKRIAKFFHKERYFSFDNYLFMKQIEDSEKIILKNVYQIWQRRLRKAGIDSGISQLSNEGKIIEDTKVNPHRLRHSRGHNLHMKGWDIREIQEFLRHSSIVSTQRYTYVDKSHLKKKLSMDVSL